MCLKDQVDLPVNKFLNFYRMLSEDNSEKEMNLIYVSQDNVYEIPPYLLMPVFSLELPSNSLQIRSIIGNGEFGKVYVGEAKGVNTTEDWTTVAIKTLTGFQQTLR